MKRLIDLSHTVEHGMITYQGLPGPIICDFLSRESSTTSAGKSSCWEPTRSEIESGCLRWIDHATAAEPLARRCRRLSKAWR